MIPIRDTVRSSTAPVVTVALIVVSVLVFLHEIALGPHVERFVYAYGLIPRRFVYWQGDPLDPLRFLPLFTSMFWHGGWLHLISNMLYLWIFGDNVEDRLGHMRYLLFYVAAGAAAGLTHVALSPTSTLPTVGASGAIFGVLGALFILERRGSIATGGQIAGLIVLNLVFTFALASHISVGGHVGGLIGGIVLMSLFHRFRRSQTLYVVGVTAAVIVASVIVAYAKVRQYQ